MIFCLPKCSSIRRARKISSNLRRNVRSLSAKLLRASCCVIVLAPWRTWPAVDVLQGRAHDAEQIVTAVLIKLIVLDRDDGVDQIARQLFVRNGLAILDVDLAEDLIVPIHDHAGRFHLFELDRSKVAAWLIETVTTERT